MKRFYSRFRIMLMTFALGLASVFVLNGSLKTSEEKTVNLPKVQFEPATIFFSIPKNQSDSSIIVSIEKRFDSKEDVASNCGGITCEEARRRAKNKKVKIPNCE